MEQEPKGLTVNASEMGELRRLLSEAWDQGYVAAGHEVRQDENPYLQAPKNPNQP